MKASDTLLDNTKNDEPMFSCHKSTLFEVLSMVTSLNLYAKKTKIPIGPIQLQPNQVGIKIVVRVLWTVRTIKQPLVVFFMSSENNGYLKNRGQ